MPWPRLAGCWILSGWQANACLLRRGWVGRPVGERFGDFPHVCCRHCSQCKSVSIVSRHGLHSTCRTLLWSHTTYKVVFVAAATAVFRLRSANLLVPDCKQFQCNSVLRHRVSARGRPLVCTMETVSAGGCIRHACHTYIA